MKYSFADYLACYKCQKSFTITVFSENKKSDNPGYPVKTCRSFCAYKKTAVLPDESYPCEACQKQEIEEGLLECPQCGKWYPIINTIPIILPNALDIFPEFLEKYKNILPEWNFSSLDKKVFEKEKLKTQKSFGFEWKIYSVTRDERDKKYCLEGGLTPDFFKGKTVLDAGCGYGRHTRIISQWAKEIIGIDLSVSIFNARNVTKDIPNVHLVQGDLFEPPFLKEKFDIVYSWGVLHHTPNPRKAFETLKNFVKSGGFYSVKIYKKFPLPAQFIERAIRLITLRLPLNLLYKTSYIAVPLNKLYWRFGKFVPGMKYFLKCFIKLDPNPEIARIDTFDWYHPQYQYHYPMEEIISWFNDCGFEEIIAIESEGVRGKKSSK
ncbi:MAG: methyltransferase domain-containing protein [Thermodesulfobacteriota bacterium]|nr:methyltransferase domain-containing protein [Thermodesulfobacteriota bacterium]